MRLFYQCNCIPVCFVSANAKATGNISAEKQERKSFYCTSILCKFGFTDKQFLYQ